MRVEKCEIHIDLKKILFEEGGLLGGSFSEVGATIGIADDPDGFGIENEDIDKD